MTTDMNESQVCMKRRSNEALLLDFNDTVNIEISRKRLDTTLDTKSPTNPVDFIKKVYQDKGCDVPVQMSTSSHLFHSPTDEEISAYTQDVLKVVRESDMEKLRSFAKEGRSLQSCNRFGESLIHLACRRGFTDVVKFLVEEANCTLYVRDDFGRTAMHDAAWSAEPNYDMMEYLIEKAPELILMSDVRGHTPFSYVRKEHWKEWILFLEKHREALVHIVTATVSDQVAN
jgi:Ankyrin repeats (3 copies)